MKRLLRSLLLLHLRRPAGLWIILAGITLLLGVGVFRVERRLDLMSLLPTEHPAVRASLEAGVGQQETLWLAAEGRAENLEAREAWAEKLVERLVVMDGVPENGMGGEGRLSAPVPVGDPKGPSLWPALLAAGSFVDGDPAVTRLVTEQFYSLAPVLLGDRMAPLAENAEVRQRFRETARVLASPDPVKARLAALDPLGLRNSLPAGNEAVARVRQSASQFPLKLRSGYLETTDGRFVLVPLVLDFPSGEAASTARVMVWLGQGAKGPLPMKASLRQVEEALAPGPGRSFALQPTGAHAIAFWETQRLGHEVVLSLALSFLLIGVVYWVGFRTLAGYGFVVVPLLLGMFWALGSVGWILGRLNLMAAAFGAVLLGIGDDVGILLFSRYREERQRGRTKSLALRGALLGTGPGVLAAGLATSLAFLACVAAPFPGFRDLGLTAGLGLLACLATSFLVLPALLLALDRGTGTFAPIPERKVHAKSVRIWKPLLASGLLLAGLAGVFQLRWEEDLRRFRQKGNPALALQETLGKVLGAGLQPLALQIPLDEPEHVARRWNAVVDALALEGMPLPRWQNADPGLRMKLGSETWYRMALRTASEEGLDPVALERPLSALRASAENPLAAPQALRTLLAQPKPSVEKTHWSLAGWLKPRSAKEVETEYLTLPMRLSEASQDRIEPALDAVGVRMVGTRPLFRAIKSVAKDALQDVVLLALVAVLGVVAFFGRKLRFVLLALVPLLASQIGVLGILGWSREPLTFLSLVAIPIALGVSVDTALNLLHRARMEPDAAARVARVNAVCAGTTLAGFGGLVFSGYRGLRGLGIACLGGTALALLVTQWLLPWMLEKWPLRGDRE
ncbi:MAG: MMPL family transporter [Holophaga sp.]|nr:MMPL family transporter [Holophaga sp.]